MCGKSQSTTSTSSPNPIAMGHYQDLLNQASGVAGLPFTPYGGEFVAPMNAQQQMAGANINQNAGFANPFIQQARQYATQAAQPVTGAQIAGFQSPYTQQVVNATEAQFANQNKQQLENVRGNAIAQGALGGDREAVAEANLANQQNLAQAPVIAGLYNQGYNTALSTALQEQQNLGQAAYSLGNLGVAGQNAALTGANAQLGFGTLGQSTQQAQDQALYAQFLAQQGYPFQVAQWLAGIDTAVGSQMGGTSSTTGPAPNPWSSIAGLGLAALSMSDRRTKHDVHEIGKTKDGQPIYRFRYKDDPSGRVHVGLMAQEVEKKHPEAVAGFGGIKYVDYDAATRDAAKRHGGGRIPGFAMGGMPYAGGSTYIPTMGLTMGQGAPKPPGSGGGQQQPDPFKLASQTMDLEKKIKGLGGSGSGDDGILYGGEALGLNQDYSAPEGILYGPEALGLEDFARGGKVRGFAGGGLADDLGGDDIPSFDDRFSGVGDYSPADTYRAEEGRRVNASEGLIPGAGLERRDWPAPTNNLSLGDIASSYAPGFQAEAPAGGPIDVSGVFHAPSGNGRLYNLTDAPDAPGVSREALSSGLAPPLPGGVDVADTRPRGLDTAAMNFAPEDRLRGYSPVPGTAGAPALPKVEGEKQAGFGLLDRLGIHLDPNMRRGLLAAGLGMMASRSPYLGVAIGEGGLAGLSAYSGAQKQQQSVEDARKKLEMHADEFQKKLALETQKVQRAQEHEQYLRDFAKEKLEQGKFTPVSGMGQDASGNQVPGTYVFNNKTGQSEFRPGMVQIPKAGAVGTPSFDQGTLTKMADQYLAGDKSVLVNLGRGAQGATDLKALRQRIAERMDEKGVTPEQQAVKMAEFQGMTAGQRALGTRTAQIEMAANEARNMMPIALQAADAVPRTSWTPINKLIEGWQTGVISDPAQARFAAANFSLVNTYVRAIAPTGVPPESARNHALQMLSGAMSHESYKAVVATMDQEMKAALASPEQVQQKFRQMYGGGGGGNAAPAAPAAAAPQEGERRQFKQGWGVYHNGQWVPAGP